MNFPVLEEDRKSHKAVWWNFMVAVSLQLFLATDSWTSKWLHGLVHYYDVLFISSNSIPSCIPFPFPANTSNKRYRMCHNDAMIIKKIVGS